MLRDLKSSKTGTIKDISSISALDTEHLPRHRWYFLKEAFSPELVTHAIQDTKCGAKDLVLDAFSGSGTVAVTAAMQGLNAITFEVNPFLAFVSRTKLVHCKESTIDSHINKVLAGSKGGQKSALEPFSTFSEAGGSKKWLFNKAVLRTFEGGWQATGSISGPIQQVFRLALIGAAMDVSNAIKDGKCLRYRPDWEEKAFGRKHFIDAFEARITDIKSDIGQYPLPKQETSICLKDFRTVKPAMLNGKKFRLCVMSPPYLNSFDYTDIYRPELFLGKFIKSSEALQQLRLKTLRSHVQVKWVDPIEVDFGQNYSDCINEINVRKDGLWNKRIPIMIQAYFEDMRCVLSNLHKIAKPNASVWIVVSTSAYVGIEVPVDLIIAEIGAKEGWLLREVRVMRYLRQVSGQQWEELSKRKNNKPHLRESIIIFDAKVRKNAK